MTDPAAVAARLEGAFRDIHTTRMADVPILNEALGVEAVGFRMWRGDVLGVLITPWFMNLMLLPGDEDRAEAWCGLKEGATVTHVLPAGRFAFIVGDEDAVGRFQMCSLFSPVFEFVDQEAAVLTAQAALAALMDEGEAEEAKAEETALDDLVHGRFEGLVPPAPESRFDEQADGERPSAMSRRQLLTGKPPQKETSLT